MFEALDTARRCFVAATAKMLILEAWYTLRSNRPTRCASFQASLISASDGAYRIASFNRAAQSRRLAHAMA